MKPAIDKSESDPNELLGSITKRETDVLKLVAEGLCNKLIAHELGISVGVVKLHVKSVLGKLNVHNRTHAAVIYVKAQLIGVYNPTKEIIVGRIHEYCGRKFHQGCASSLPETLKTGSVLKAINLDEYFFKE